MKTKKHPTSLFLVFILLALQVVAETTSDRSMLTASEAPSMVLFDQKITINHWPPEFPFAEGVPEDWTKGADYRGGTFHLHCDILSRPDQRALGMTVGLRTGSGDFMNMFQHFSIHGPGVYRHHTPVRRLFHMGEGSLQDPGWPRGPKVVFIHFRENGNLIRRPGPGLYPVVMHLTVTLVPAGGRYQEPGLWGGLSYADIDQPEALRRAWRLGQLGAAASMLPSATADDDLTPEQLAVVKRVRAALAKYQQDEVTRITSLYSQDPLSAIDELTVLSERLQGGPGEREIRELGQQWQRDPATRAERAADLRWQRLQAQVAAWQALADNDQRRARGAQIIQRSMAEIERHHQGTVAHRQALALIRQAGLAEDQDQ